MHLEVCASSGFAQQSYGQDEMACHLHPIYRWYYAAVDKKAEEWFWVEQSRELCSDIRGRGGASNACFHS